MMRRLSAFRVMGVAAVAGVLLTVGALPAAAATVTLSASGSGSNEVPAGAASDKIAGTFEIDVDAGTLTYMVSLQASEPAIAGHIHKGAAGTNGDVVIPLDTAAVNSGASTTVAVDKTLLAAIAADPAGYYLNAHTASAPSGVARGQLVAGSGSMPTAVKAGTGGQFAALQDGGFSAPMIALAIGGGLLLLGAVGFTVQRRRS